MKREVAELICEHADSECRINDGYSGRGMCGEITAGLVADDPMLCAIEAIHNLLFKVAVLDAMTGDQNKDHTFFDRQDANAIAQVKQITTEIAGGVRYDSMGRSGQIMY